MNNLAAEETPLNDPPHAASDIQSPVPSLLVVKCQGLLQFATTLAYKRGKLHVSGQPAHATRLRQLMQNDLYSNKFHLRH